MDFYVLTYITVSEHEDWNILSCLNHLKDHHHIQFTSDSKEEVLDAFISVFKQISESDTANTRTKRKAKTLYNNAHETFQRKEIIEFFEKMDQEFDAVINLCFWPIIITIISIKSINLSFIHS